MKNNTPKDSHYARLRRNFREQKQFVKNSYTKTPNNERIFIYGLHSVNAALANENRKIYRLLVTKNAATRLIIPKDNRNITPTQVEAKEISALLDADAVHQGVVLETKPLKTKKLDELTNAKLILVLDQITDPHNIGAIMRSAVAFNADAIISVARNTPKENSVLAKAASGAVDNIDYIVVKNLAQALNELSEKDFQTIGLDSEGDLNLEETFQKQKIALILGSEGKGLRQKTRETVSCLARLDMPGKIKSLNVSNAAAIALYAAHRFLN